MLSASMARIAPTQKDSMMREHRIQLFRNRKIKTTLDATQMLIMTMTDRCVYGKALFLQIVYGDRLQEDSTGKSQRASTTPFHFAEKATPTPSIQGHRQGEIPGRWPCRSFPLSIDDAPFVMISSAIMWIRTISLLFFPPSPFFFFFPRFWVGVGREIGPDPQDRGRNHKRKAHHQSIKETNGKAIVLGSLLDVS